MHRSIFTYNVTRPYPYPWFTWVVVIGGIIATALFSVVSVAANGYDTALVTVSSPNETENPSSPEWFQKQPWSLANKVSPKCQDQLINVGSSIKISTLGHFHLLQRMYKRDNTRPTPQYVLAYHNSALENCFMSAARLSAWPTGFNVSFRTVCTVYENHAPVSIELRTTWNAPVRVGGGVGNPRQWPSWFVWMDALLAAQQQIISTQLDETGGDTNWTARSDYDFTTPTKEVPEPRVLLTTSMTYGNTTVTGQIGNSNSYLLNKVSDRLTSSTATNSHVSLSMWSTNSGLKALSLFETFSINQYPYQYPQPWSLSNPIVSIALTADNLMRIIYSSLMSEFGQDTPSNILAAPESLFNYTYAATEMYQQMGQGDLMLKMSPFFANGVSILTSNQTALQNISSLFAWANTTIPSVPSASINTLYLCQVPKMKSVISLVFTVVIADLVFLRALWFMLGFIVKMLLEHRDETVNHCTGCIESKQHERPASTIRPFSSEIASNANNRRTPAMNSDSEERPMRCPV